MPPRLRGGLVDRTINTGWAGAKLSTRVPGVLGSWTARVTWLERELLAGLVTWEPLLRRPLVFDVDDAIWVTGPSAAYAAASIGKRAAVVVAGNTYIADWFSRFAKDVRIVPTAIDTDRFKPAGPGSARSDTPFTIGWTGLAVNHVYLYAIEAVLEAFLTRHHARLLVLTEHPPRFHNIQPQYVQFVKWSRANEADTLREMDVGIMPLEDNEFDRGKCSFKMLQYMASGLPVVVSPVGMNSDVLALGRLGFAAESLADWHAALETLYRDRILAGEMGAVGRQVAQRFYSSTVVSPQIASVLKELG